MARPLRLQVAGGIYHVTARGNDRRPIFDDDDDCARFLMVLASIVTRYHVLCHAYCLMSNHYHLLLETPEANLSVAMRQLNGVYTQRFNRRHERCGHLLQGRYGAQLVNGDSYLQEVCRYVVLNPVRGGLVAHPRQWRWSSFQATAGETTTPGFLTVGWVQALGGAKTRTEALRRYIAFIEAGIGETESPLDGFKSKSAVGDETFLTHFDEECRRTAPSAEIPRAQRFAGRPPLSQLFRGVTSKAERNACAVLAVRDHGYAMREVAEFIGRHYATVSRAVSYAD
ncbi:MAG: REP-associated tyrosine transposase, partial [bacterium]